MKYFSELLNKPFESEKECLDAEKAYEKEQKKLAEEQAIKEAEENKTKKELAKAIDSAEENLTEANKLYDLAKEKAKEILEKSNKEVKEILDVAEEEVKKAQEQRLEAIRTFNKRFGTYTTTLTGAKALDEYNRAIRNFDNFFNKFFRF